MSVIEPLLARAADYADAYRRSAPSTAPRLALAVVACMDARLSPNAMLGLSEGDAHVIRNAGGVVTDDTLRSLAASQHLLGTTGVMIIQHTDCGLSHTTDAAFEEQLRTLTVSTPAWALGSFVDLEASIRTSLKLVRSCPFLLHRDDVRGFAFDVETGELREIEGRDVAA
jgi:carbonic anhydrase